MLNIKMCDMLRTRLAKDPIVNCFLHTTSSFHIFRPSSHVETYAYIEFFKGGGAHRKGGGLAKFFLMYFMIFDIFETIFSASLVLFIRKLTRFPRICAQILFKTDIFNFFSSQKGGGRARAQEPPPPYIRHWVIRNICLIRTANWLNSHILLNYICYSRIRGFT